MSSLRERTLAKVRKEKLVDAEGETYLVIAPSRCEKSRFYNECTKDGELDPAHFEGMMLAHSVYDPETREILLSNPDDWDLTASLTGPLIEAAAELWGLNKKETSTIKNSDATES